MRLTYATEATPLGTAGSVRNAREALRDDAFLVMSGDALTDIDLSKIVRATAGPARWSRCAGRAYRTRSSSAS